MDLSIIIPCYNEENKIVNNVHALREYMQSHLPDITYEVLVVNDGSVDGTEKALHTAFDSVTEVRIYSYAPNRGKGYAVKHGITNAIGATVLFMDADLATDLSAIDTVMEFRDQYDIIIGSRKEKDSVYQQSKLRLFISKCCNICSNCIIPLHLHDTQCGFKAFKNNCAKKIITKQQMDGFSFDVELLYIAKLHGYTMHSIPVKWKNGQDSRVHVIKSSVKFFQDLFAIRRNKPIYLQS